MCLIHGYWWKRWHFLDVLQIHIDHLLRFLLRNWLLLSWFRDRLCNYLRYGLIYIYYYRFVRRLSNCLLLVFGRALAWLLVLFYLSSLWLSRRGYLLWCRLR